MVVLFVGVGFSEAQAFAVKYSKVNHYQVRNHFQDKYEIISYEHTSEVNSSKLDTLVKELACNAFEEGSDPDYDGQLDYDGYMLFNNFKDFLNAKIQLSNPGTFSRESSSLQIMIMLRLIFMIMMINILNSQLKSIQMLLMKQLIIQAFWRVSRK